MEQKFYLGKTLKSLKISYMGATRQSKKMRLSYNNNVETYCLYLAPADLSGYNTCPNNKHCKAFCLNGSGQNKADILARGVQHSKINLSRIKKTKLFFENKDLFMRIVIAEIIKAKKHADKNGKKFAVRLNGTSDISPEDFVYNGQNILEIFPDVQFYDYTKVPNRFPLIKKYPNYDITYSYNGYNWERCKHFLNEGGKVAIVFADKTMPKKFDGFDVIDANEYDMRYLDPNKTIMGLHYHPVASDFKNGHFVKPNTPFIIQNTDNRCEY